MMKLYSLQTEQLNDPDFFSREYEKMPPYRQEKINAFRFEKDKKLSLGAGMLLRRGLTEAGLDPEQTTILFGNNGKPYLAGEKVYFSLSHSGNYVIAAFADSEIGCDVEMIDDIDMKIARRFFSSEEVNTLERLTDIDNRKNTFFRFWTLKESYLKMTGEGITRELNSFTIHLDSPITAEVKGEKQAVAFEEYEWDGYRAAVCLNLKHSPTLEESK